MPVLAVPTADTTKKAKNFHHVFVKSQTRDKVRTWLKCKTWFLSFLVFYQFKTQSNINELKSHGRLIAWWKAFRILCCSCILTFSHTQSPDWYRNRNLMDRWKWVTTSERDGAIAGQREIKISAPLKDSGTGEINSFAGREALEPSSLSPLRCKHTYS